MGFLDALLGQTKPVRPNLDALFAIPAAAYTIQAALDLVPTGVGAVCFKTAEGHTAARAEADALALLGTDPATGTATSTDEYGYTWIACHRNDGGSHPDLAGLVGDLHAVNTTLTDAGYGPSLLCTIIGFTKTGSGSIGSGGSAHRLGLVYLFKRGTFYPFAPTGEHARDTDLEMQVRAHLRGDLPIESDLGRWFPIWATPALPSG